MAIAKLKIAMVAVVTLGVGIILVLEHRANHRLRGENQDLERQVALLRSAKEARGGATEAKAAGPSDRLLQEEQLRDLNRLRSQVQILRQAPEDLPRLQAENRELKAATDEPEDPAEAEFKEQTVMRMNQVKQWALSFFLYAGDHDDRFPETFEQAAHIQGMEALLGFVTNHFEVTFRGTIKEVRDPGKTLLFREKQAQQAPDGRWVKVYGFADGHSEAHAESAEADFAAWERDRMVSVPVGARVTPDSP